MSKNKIVREGFNRLPNILLPYSQYHLFGYIGFNLSI